MFKIFKKAKKIETSKVNNLKIALKIINQFIYTKDFEKAQKAINEIIKKESDFFDVYITKIKDKNKKQEILKFKKNIKNLEKLKDEISIKIIKNEQIKNKKIKILEVKETKKSINLYIWEKKFLEAIKLINILLEKYPKDSDIMLYCNKSKKQLQNKLNKLNSKEKKDIKNDTLKEIQNLIWDIDINLNSKEIEENNNSKNNFLSVLKNKTLFLIHLKNKLNEKKLIDEVDILLKVNDNNKENLIKSKLENVHSWYIKEYRDLKINWYDFYAKVISADKISWDNLWFEESKNSYWFYIWDATGHWIKAWFIISKLTNIFSDLFQKKSFKEIVMEINNSLKQELKSWNFITSIFFEIKKENQELNIIWMWHLPIYIYRSEKKIIEKVIPWWLRAWIRIIKDINFLKEKNIVLNNNDILFTYTDWIIETKNNSWELFGFKRLEDFFLKSCKKISSLKKIEENIIEELKKYNKDWKNFWDDVSVILIKKDKDKIILDDNKELDNIILKEKIDFKYKKKLKNKNIDELKFEIEKIRKQEALKWILKNLDILYKTWELLKVKQDCIKYIKNWFIDKRINFYLKKSIENETKVKIILKDKKTQDKYNILLRLYKNWEYETVINESYNMINKDWNI